MTSGAGRSFLSHAVTGRMSNREPRGLFNYPPYRQLYGAVVRATWATRNATKGPPHPDLLPPRVTSQMQRAAAAHWSNVPHRDRDALTIARWLHKHYGVEVNSSWVMKHVHPRRKWSNPRSRKR